MPWRPCREQSHQPSRPPVFCSMTVRMSPLRKASSSGDSGTLSYNAFAIRFCKREREQTVVRARCLHHFNIKRAFYILLDVKRAVLHSGKLSQLLSFKEFDENIETLLLLLYFKYEATESSSLAYLSTKTRNREKRLARLVMSSTSKTS